MPCAPAQEREDKITEAYLTKALEAAAAAAEAD